ncbi:MAG: hypothetical protein VKS61_00195 [Candidatus Sericytochromatia bacterium]|nr:hypothetical protein [Candidatus Sericytochromatia bacterium]
MMGEARGPEWRHMAELLEALQRNAYFLHASACALPWPIEAQLLAERRKDVPFFTELAAFNERFGKLQDSLGHAMRHAALLAGEPVDRFLKVLAFYEKAGVLDAIASWQAIRLARNQAAHAYTVDDRGTADHFNELHALLPALLGTSVRFVAFVEETLGVGPEPGHFTGEFAALGRGW